MVTSSHGSSALALSLGPPAQSNEGSANSRVPQGSYANKEGSSFSNLFQVSDINPSTVVATTDHLLHTCTNLSSKVSCGAEENNCVQVQPPSTPLTDVLLSQTSGIHAACPSDNFSLPVLDKAGMIPVTRNGHTIASGITHDVVVHGTGSSESFSTDDPIPGTTPRATSTSELGSVSTPHRETNRPFSTFSGTPSASLQHARSPALPAIATAAKRLRHVSRPVLKFNVHITPTQERVQLRHITPPVLSAQTYRQEHKVGTASVKDMIRRFERLSDTLKNPPQIKKHFNN